MAKKKKARWGKGTVFLVPLLDGSCGVGQVVTNEVMGSPTVALFSVRVPSECQLDDLPDLEAGRCIALLTLLGLHALEKELWRSLGNLERVLDSSQSENWKHRGRQWVGARLFSDNIVEALLNAYHGFEAWDDFADPEALDKLLLPPHTRPKSAWLSKSN